MQSESNRDAEADDRRKESERRATYMAGFLRAFKAHKQRENQVSLNAI